jgi:hypothetical protein
MIQKNSMKLQQFFNDNLATLPKILGKSFNESVGTEENLIWRKIYFGSANYFLIKLHFPESNAMEKLLADIVGR